LQPRLQVHVSAHTSQLIPEGVKAHVILNVLEIMSFVVLSYSSFHGVINNCVIIDKYQAQNFLGSPENLGQSVLKTILSTRTVDSLENNSVNISIILAWMSVEPALEYCTGVTR
jgi:hypothetical protein